MVRDHGEEPNDIVLEEVSSLYKGNLRLAVLRCLKEGSRETTSIVKRLDQITKGEWSPSPTSIKTVLEDLRGFGILDRSMVGGRTEYFFTEKGKESYKLLYERISDHIDFLDWILRSD